MKQKKLEKQIYAIGICVIGIGILLLIIIFFVGITNGATKLLTNQTLTTNVLKDKQNELFQDDRKAHEQDMSCFKHVWDYPSLYRDIRDGHLYYAYDCEDIREMEREEKRESIDRCTYRISGPNKDGKIVQIYWNASCEIQREDLFKNLIIEITQIESTTP